MVSGKEMKKEAFFLGLTYSKMWDAWKLSKIEGEKCLKFTYWHPVHYIVNKQRNMCCN